MSVVVDHSLPSQATPASAGTCPATLVMALESACRAPADEVPTAAAHALAEHGDAVRAVLPDAVWRGSACGYGRHVLHADPGGRFTVVALSWLPGQATPIHGHYTWCTWRVVAGELHEERFRLDASGRWAHHESVARGVGSSSGGHAGMDAGHRLQHAVGHPAVSIHVYGIDSERVATHVNRLVAER